MEEKYWESAHMYKFMRLKIYVKYNCEVNWNMYEIDIIIIFCCFQNKIL